MKKVILSLVALATFGFVSAQDSETNNTTVGVKGGVNLATLSGADAGGTDTRTSITAGVFFEVPISDKFSFQPEILYSSKGAKASGYVQGMKVNMVMKFNYIEVPLIFKYYVADKFSLEAGPYLAYLAAAKANVKTLSESGTGDIKNIMKEFDAGIGIGANYDASDKIFFNFRYTTGLVEVGDEYGFKDIKNSVVQFGLGYKF